MRINKRKKLICGVGVNDADYPITCYKDGKQVICPFYTTWVNMLVRCYDPKFQMKSQRYKGCSTVPQWHLFSNFRSWMIQEDWQGKELDKDLLVQGNKVYGPETCVFVDARVNTFIVEGTARRGEWPIGVCSFKGKFMAQCWSVVTGKQEYLGLFKTPEEAHAAWLSYKLQQAYILAEQQSDVRVANALIARYEGYK